MAKQKTAFVCENCGYDSPKWLGKCPSCNQWNTFKEIKLGSGKKHDTDSLWETSINKPGDLTKNKAQKLSSISTDEQPRIITTDLEFNRVLGGGIVPGSLVLIGGEPGIGKSTLMLQISESLGKDKKVLYVSGEESAQQISMRAKRMSLDAGEIYLLTETQIDQIFKEINTIDPDLIIIDSIQTTVSPQNDSMAGSITQIRDCTSTFMKFAKQTQTSVILIGHITKDGSIAGPKILEHMVDTVLQFEGDRHLSYRILRTTKNRFGSTAELGIYEMIKDGLRQVNNPSEILLSQREEHSSGIAIGATLEGNRPLLVEIQALVSSAAYGTPQRTCTGFDVKRLNMILAVLEKRMGFRLNAYDVFINIAGGIKIEDPAIDLAVCAAVISSANEIPVPRNACFAGEVGLSGEIRAVNRVDNRLAEAEKLGMDTFYLSSMHKKSITDKKNINLGWCNKLGDALSDWLVR
ncbi:DNA repair protein RadA [Marinigracilibium pacificum]|uniref:DNA repair protein RadA n=1 Tax=Marinigracilibium pacificum TaxID=2729599 RepID=A0A848IT54_9BACT|nr:DNA repair protein RadA [Marinigracilibium pacificum]NMM46956.1 DNA repair protein RadA [Marinigracilibium pacificum]